MDSAHEGDRALDLTPQGRPLPFDPAIQKPTFSRTQSATAPVSPITSAVRGIATALTRASLQMFDLLPDFDGVIDFDAEVANGALDLRMSALTFQGSVVER